MEDERKPSKTIHTRSLIQLAEAFEKMRRDWINILVDNPKRSDAAEKILVITARIEAYDDLLRGAYLFRGINDHEL